MRKFEVVAGLRVRIGSKLDKWLRKHFRKLFAHVKKHRKPIPVPAPVPAPTPAPVPAPKPPPVSKIYMYDDVNVDLIPKNAQAVAGYIGGQWPTFPKVQKGWPHAKHLSIAVSSIYNADCLDVEPGDAPIAYAPAWVKKQLALRKTGNGYNTTKPVVYTSASWGQKLVDALSAAGLRYGIDYLWWSAHYDPSKGEHICSPKCGFGLKVTAHATQFTDMAQGKHLDESVVKPGFFV